jgi:hypothetical protein
MDKYSAYDPPDREHASLKCSFFSSSFSERNILYQQKINTLLIYRNFW